MAKRNFLTADQLMTVGRTMHKRREVIRELSHTDALAMISNESGVTIATNTFRQLADELNIELRPKRPKIADVTEQLRKELGIN